MNNLAPVIPEYLLNKATESLLSRGIRIFQGARMAPTDRGHVAALLEKMAPPTDAIVVDMGCGIGEVARLMRDERPDLKFWLVNNNAAQLAHARSGIALLADMHDTGLRPECADGVMFCYSLCHSDFERALIEGARITKPGGFLFVYDYERMAADDRLFSRVLCARALSRTQMTEVAADAGWRVDIWENPKTDDASFRNEFPNDVEYNAIFDDLRVCAWRAIRL